MDKGGFGKLKSLFPDISDSSIGKIIQGLIQEQVYTQIFLNCHLAAFLHET